MGIEFEKVSYTYELHSPFERRTLFDLNLKIQPGVINMIVGQTGSGKSTILQHMNGLLRPTEGIVRVDEFTIDQRKKQPFLKDIRNRVGIVFQNPEQQLFEETVEKDIMFGPMNFGVSSKEAKERAIKYLLAVGLNDSFLNRSPFELSGGQMRRVAIAGVLAMEPTILILDEPTAGLDPKGQLEILELIQTLNKQENLTIVIVTHHMEDVLRYGDHVFVVHRGRIVREGSPFEIFHDEDLEKLGLAVPKAIQLKKSLEDIFTITLDRSLRTFEDVVRNFDQVTEGIYRNKGESYE